MKKLFDELSYRVSKETTKQYSTSFSLGILALSPKIRNPIYAVYGYVRLADEIVDSFHGYDKEKLLTKFREETYQALEDGISLNPILQSFQDTVNRFDIDKKLINQFLDSMQMDLQKVDYNSDLYKQYILGSAEVVGLMCLQIFVEGNIAEFERLKPFAMKLGSAFQKVNFLRDMKDDYQILGRSYFPDVDITLFDNKIKADIEKDIEKEFYEALIGIKKLPSSSRFGVYLAYRYYISLFRKIKRTLAHKIINQRIRISNSKKISLMMSSYLQYKTSFLLKIIMIHRLYKEQQLNCDIEKAWKFFSSANNLSKITPKDMKFVVLTKTDDDEIYKGMIIDYHVSPLLGIKMNWTTEIKQVDFQKSFTDYQQKGPYKLWNHFHEFIPNEKGVLMKDTVDYELPMGFLGEIAHKLFVKSKLEHIFSYRNKVLDKMFNNK